VHVNAEFFDQASDHDPSVVRITLDQAPTAHANGPYAVSEGGSTTVSAAGSDPEGGALTFAWDLDHNGSFETIGRSATFSAASIDGPATRTIAVRVTDAAGKSDVDEATVQIENVAPTATLVAPASTSAGFPFTLALTNADDASAADVAAGFAYAFDCGAGYGSFGLASSTSCPTSAVGTLNVGAKIRDKDGGTREYRGTVDVGVTFDSLCALTETLVGKTDVAQALCDKLDAAEAANARGNTKARDNVLGAYRNQLDAQTGKSVSPADAALLRRLSLQLQG